MKQSLSTATAQEPGAGRHLILSATDMAFLRGWVQGVDVVLLSDRYLSCGKDVRRIRAELRRLRHAVELIARRLGDRDAVAVLKRDANSLSTSERLLLPPLPTLDEFVLERRLQVDFYTESELLELYTSAYPARSDAGASKREHRRGRLMERQLAALARIERAVMAPPERHHPVSSWLPAYLASRLERSGLRTLGDVCRRYSERGGTWFRRVPGLGAAGASYVEKWWSANSASLGELVRGEWTGTQLESAGPDLPARRNIIVPFEQISYEHVAKFSKAYKEDVELVALFLATRECSDSLKRAYRSECERLLAWTHYFGYSSLLELGPPAAARYFGFLRHPEPAEDWIMPTKLPRTSIGWRPLCGPRSDPSIGLTSALVVTFFKWLCDQRPGCAIDVCAWRRWQVDSCSRPEKTGRKPTRSAIRRYAAGPVNRIEQVRTRAALVLLHATGLSIAALCRLRIADISRQPDGALAVATRRGSVVLDKSSSACVLDLVSSRCSLGAVAGAQDSALTLFGPLQSVRRRNEQREAMVTDADGINPSSLSRSISRAIKAQRSAGTDALKPGDSLLR